MHTLGKQGYQEQWSGVKPAKENPTGSLTALTSVSAALSLHVMLEPGLQGSLEALHMINSFQKVETPDGWVKLAL